MLNDTAANLMVTGLTAAALRMSLHTAYSATGANKVTGGSYADKTIAWGAAASRKAAMSAPVDFDVPSGTTVKFQGFWNTGGSTFYGMMPVGVSGSTPKKFWIDGSTSYIYSPAHGYTADQSIILMGTVISGNVLFGGNVNFATQYYVTGEETNRFRIATGTGGTGTVTFSDSVQYPNANCIVQRYAPETFDNAGVFTASTYEIGITF